MKTPQVFHRGGRWLHYVKLINQPAHFQNILQPPLALWAFGGGLGLQELPRRGKHANGPLVVPKAAFVPVKSGFTHAVNPCIKAARLALKCSVG